MAARDRSGSPSGPRVERPRWRALPARLGSVAGIALPALGAGCGDPTLLGSDVVWSSDHESGDLRDWSLAPGGGAYVNPEAGGAFEPSSDFSRSGRYAVKLTSPGAAVEAGPLLYRDIGGAAQLYFSVWYYIPIEYDSVD